MHAQVIYLIAVLWFLCRHQSGHTLFVRLWPQKAHPHVFSLFISIHQRMIYRGSLHGAGLFVSEYARLCAPLGLIYSTAGWRSNKRMSMGDLTSTNIAIIILLKPLISATPLDHRCVPGPAAHKNHSHFHRVKEKGREA